MTTRDVGTALRLLGPGLQVLCLIALFTAPGAHPGAGIGGRRLLLYAGFGVGLVLVLVGNILARAVPRPAPGRSFDLHLDDTAFFEPSKDPMERK